MGTMDRVSISDCRLTAFWVSVESDITRTEMLERKLTALTLITPMASTMGLMITPPPIPQSGPRSEARKHTMKTGMNCSCILLGTPRTRTYDELSVSHHI